MAEYPPDAAVSLPDDITTTTPGQFADWHAAECAYRTGVGAYHLTHGDPRAAGEEFNASNTAYAVAALTRALMQHAPDAVDELVADINATFTAGDASEYAGEWLHEIGVDGFALYEAGRADIREEVAVGVGEICRASSAGAYPDLPYECERTAGHDGAHRAQTAPLEWGSDPDRCCGGHCSDSDGELDGEDSLARRVAALEDLIADQATVLERQSRDIETLRAAMGSAQAAIRGLAQHLPPATYSPEGDG